MIRQTTNLLTLFNSVLTNFSKGIVEYKTKPDPILTNKFHRFFKLSLPESVNKADVKYLLITARKKATSSTGGYFKRLDSNKTEHFILSPSFEDECIEVRIGNICNNNEDDLKAAYILEIKEEFKEKERKALSKIFEVKKTEIDTLNTRIPYYDHDTNLKIYSYFETEYITNDLKALRAEENVEELLKKIIDFSLTKGLMKRDISKYVYLYFTTNSFLKNKDLTYTKDEEIKTESFDTWPSVFVKNFTDSLNFEHWVSIKKYFKDMTTENLIDSSVNKAIAESFKRELENHYNAKSDSLQINNLYFDVENAEIDTKFIFRFLKKQYSYFYEVLKEVHRTAQSINQAAKNIIDFGGTNIEMFKELLTTYQKSFGGKGKNTISQFIKNLKAKLNEAVEASDFKTRKAQLELFTALKDEQKVLQFTLILNESEYVYPKFYIFTGDALNLVEDEADVEVYRIINKLETYGPQGPKVIRGLSAVYSRAEN